MDEGELELAIGGIARKRAVLLVQRRAEARDRRAEIRFGVVVVMQVDLELAVTFRAERGILTTLKVSQNLAQGCPRAAA